MPTQRRNRQRKNRRNSQRRNRKNLQRGGIWPFNDDSKDDSDTTKKKPWIQLPDWLSFSHKTGNTEPVQTANTEPVQIANTEPVQIANTEPVQTANTEPVDHSHIDFEPVVVDPNAAENKKENEVRKIPGGKQKKSNKKNKRSNKKR